MRSWIVVGGCAAGDPAEGPARRLAREPLDLVWVDEAPLRLVEEDVDQHHAVLAQRAGEVALVVQVDQRSVLAGLEGDPPEVAYKVPLDRFFDHPALAADPAGGWLVAGRDRAREALLVRSVHEAGVLADAPAPLPAEGAPVFPDLASDGGGALVATMTAYGAALWWVAPGAATVAWHGEVRNPGGWRTGSPSVAASPQGGFLAVGSRRGPSHDELWAVVSDGVRLGEPWVVLRLEPWEQEARIQATAWADGWAVAWRHRGQAAFGLLPVGGAPEGVVALGPETDRPVLACGRGPAGDLLVVAWEAGGEVRLGAWDPAAEAWLGDPLLAGPGARPDLMVREDEVWLTWEEGPEGARQNQLRRAALKGEGG
jgi:hypothetical protein